MSRPARLLVVVLVSVPLLAGSPPAARSLGEVTVKAGRWHGVAWKLVAGGFPDGSYCTAMTVGPGEEDGRGCGNVHDGRIGYMAHNGRPAPDYVVGPVVATARSIRITFFERSPIRVATVAPPRTFALRVRFYAAVLPCPATPRDLVARDRSGRVVARFVVQVLPPLFPGC